MNRKRVLKFPQWISVALVWAALFLGLLSMRPNTTFAAEDAPAADTIVIT